MYTGQANMKYTKLCYQRLTNTTQEEEKIKMAYKNKQYKNQLLIYFTSLALLTMRNTFIPLKLDTPNNTKCNDPFKILFGRLEPDTILQNTKASSKKTSQTHRMVATLKLRQFNLQSSIFMFKSTHW